MAKKSLEERKAELDHKIAVRDTRAAVHVEIANIRRALVAGDYEAVMQHAALIREQAGKLAPVSE